jgi:hypothetical protein
MSDENQPEVPSQPTQPQLLPVALFNGGSVRILMGLFGPDGGPKYPAFQILHLSGPGVPNASLTLPELATLKALIDTALKEGVAMTSQTFQFEPVGAPKKDEER